MGLEELKYVIETRHGVNYANADGLFRAQPCTGKKCICEGVANLEHSMQVVDTYEDANILFYPASDLEDTDDSDGLLEPTNIHSTHTGEKPFPYDLDTLPSVPCVQNIQLISCGR